ncbi:hypothetical protein [Bradyrhizobium sp. SZCCHNS3052]|uniref:hypothetical protein n=1 Tax=Bradyrhizobium sp. SZCCHNS3052 TaxID=3057321 RepID=UPI0029165BF3|nr:hypothetical protein [Bradyrhizobium sp. SZCCHNS3052]
MKCLLSVLVAVVFGASTASAQSQAVYRYDIGVIDNSIKCELGQVAKLLARSSPVPPAVRMVAAINVSGEDVVSRKISGGIDFFGKFGGGYEKKAGRKRGMEGVRNIHVDNSVNCRKRNIVDVGVLSCFQEQAPAFVAGQTITCNDSSTATSNVNAGGKFQIFVVGAEVSGELANTRTWTIDLVAPPRPK